MGSNNKNDKFKREQCRQEIAKQYKDEIQDLKSQVERLYEQRVADAKLIEEQKRKINEQEERLNLYKMVVNLPESDIVKLMNEANTKHEFLEAMSQINKIFKMY